MGFTKLDSGIIHSSIWSEPVETRVLWITMLALCDENGFVSVSVPGLVRAANISNETFESAITTLGSPDAYSRTPDNEGRRVEKVDGGWMILNFLKYRSHSEIIKEQTRERVRKFREKKQYVTQGNVTETLPSASVSASSSDSGLVLKDKYLDRIYMSKDEYKKLCEKYGKEKTDECIEFLDGYLTNNPKKERQYKSHYKCIITWVYAAVQERRGKESKGGIF